MVVTTKGEGRGGATGIRWIDARDAVKHPTKYRRPHTTKPDPVQNIHGAEDGKLELAYCLIQHSAHGGDQYM